jgi:hypothetical protein
LPDFIHWGIIGNALTMPTTSKEYREFAAECLRWATEVAEEERQAFLDMARDWTLAAMRLEGILVPESETTNFPLGSIAMPTTSQHVVRQQQQPQPESPEKNE